jgi:cyclopropane fatty-acyl-phospholipid synthase-like methyltransferase
VDRRRGVVAVEKHPQEVDYFASKASDYESEKRRVDNVDAIAGEIVGRVHLDRGMHIADFGSGTGLLLKRLAPFVSRITAIDRSVSMNGVLRASIDEIECEVEIVECDIEVDPPSHIFDGIVSSMTMHHIGDIDALFRTFYDMLRPGGFIALADLDSEDGTFHTVDTGVRHHGFDREWISRKAREAGFANVEISDASVVEKPYGLYPVFLLTGERP